MQPYEKFSFPYVLKSNLNRIERFVQMPWTQENQLLKSNLNRIESDTSVSGGSGTYSVKIEP